MAREGYLVNAGEETIHENVITAQTKKDKFKNWWYYNKKILLLVIFLVAVAVSIVWSIVGKVKPDYTIALMTQSSVDADALEILEKHIADYGEDLNGDGKVVVNIANYAVANSTDDNAYDYNAQMAAQTQFVADMSTAESMIWIYDDVGKASMGDIGDVFKNLNYDSKSTDKTEIAWSEVKGLANTDFSGYSNSIFTPENIVQMLDQTKVSIRESKDTFFEKKEKTMVYYNACQKLLDNLVEDKKTVEG